MKLALVLYAAHAPGQAPAARARPARAAPTRCWSSSAARCLLVVTQPDLGTRDGDRLHDRRAAASRPASPLRKLALAGRLRARGGGVPLRAGPAVRAGAPDLASWIRGRTPPAAAFRRCRVRSRSARAGCSAVGPGESVQKIFYLPEAPTDFILAVIAEELGVVGVCALLFLYGLIAYAGLRAAKARAQPLQRADRRRRDLADRLPGAAERVRRARPRAAHRRPAAVRLLRLEQPDRDARVRWACCSTSPPAAPRTCARCRRRAHALATRAGAKRHDWSRERERRGGS